MPAKAQKMPAVLQQFLNAFSSKVHSEEPRPKLMMGTAAAIALWSRNHSISVLTGVM